MDHRVKLIATITACGLLLHSCSEKSNSDFLGSAVISGKTYQITAVTQGNIVQLSKDEGDAIHSGELLAVIDTVQLALKLNEINAGTSEINATTTAKSNEIKALRADVDGLKREFTRMDTLSKKGAVPTQQRDNLETQYEASLLRLQANQNVLSSYMEKIKGQQARIGQLKDQIKNCYLFSPTNGVVLTRYRNLMEVVGPGSPIFEIGRFDTLQADFFVPQTLLASLKYGQKLRIRIDMPSNSSSQERFIPAQLTWISPEAEFSPKNIQTRESRNELVFKVRATIPNPEGLLKRGLPIEVWR